MKYKPGDKFIIEIERCVENCAPPSYKLKNGMFSISEKILCNLKPYSKKEDYQRGLDDAWEAARKIVCEDGLSFIELTSVFGTNAAHNILKYNTAAEAIAKICAYEEVQNIKVGDEITYGELKAIALEVSDGYVHYMRKDGAVSFLPLEANVWKKTGRHFPEVAALIEKLKEETHDV